MGDPCRARPRPHSAILFEPSSRVLISADALWANGFGVVFPELEGEQGFCRRGSNARCDRGSFAPSGCSSHGALFSDVDQALGTARSRLDNFMRNPCGTRCTLRRFCSNSSCWSSNVSRCPFLKWAMQTRYFRMLHARHFMETDMVQWPQQLLTDLEHSGVLRHEDHWLINT